MRKNLLLVVGVSLGALLLFWLPFIRRVETIGGVDFGQHGMETVVQNFDGINFLMIAKSWYDPDKLEGLIKLVDPGQSPKYYTAHYPLTAGVIWVINQVTTGPRAVIYTIILANILLAAGLYIFFGEFVGKKSSYWLTIVALFLPARMLSVRGVLSTETIFIPLTLLSIVLAKRNKHWGAAVLGALAVLTRSPGIILFGAFAMAFIIKRDILKIKLKQAVPYLLIPLTLVSLWGFYGWQYGSILAYFQSGDNLHLFFPPFKVFGTSESWSGGMWREDIIYVYLLFTVGVVSWAKRIWDKTNFVNLSLAIYPILFMSTIFFVSHRDIARYSLPIAPFVIAGFAPQLEKKWVRWIILVMIIPIYLLGWQFIVQNIQPISDWTLLL